MNLNFFKKKNNTDLKFHPDLAWRVMLVGFFIILGLGFGGVYYLFNLLGSETRAEDITSKVEALESITGQNIGWVGEYLSSRKEKYERYKIERPALADPSKTL